MSLIRQSYHLDNEYLNIPDITIRETIVWSDLNTTFRVKNKDIIQDVNIVALRNALENIITTSRYEVPGFPEFGMNLERFIGEFNDELTVEEISDFVKEQIERWEPRVVFDKLEMIPTNDQNSLQLKVYFTIKSSDKPDIVNIRVNRR